jgi:hypothetical protein
MGLFIDPALDCGRLHGTAPRDAPGGIVKAIERYII